MSECQSACDHLNLFLLDNNYVASLRRHQLALCTCTGAVSKGRFLFVCCCVPPFVHSCFSPPPGATLPSFRSPRRFRRASLGRIYSHQLFPFALELASLASNSTLAYLVLGPPLTDPVSIHRERRNADQTLTPWRPISRRFLGCSSPLSSPSHCESQPRSRIKRLFWCGSCLLHTVACRTAVFLFWMGSSTQMM